MHSGGHAANSSKTVIQKGVQEWEKKAALGCPGLVPGQGGAKKRIFSKSILLSCGMPLDERANGKGEKKFSVGWERRAERPV